MKKYYLKILLFAILISFSIFMVIYGERDDSPGGQFLGLVLFIIGVRGIMVW